MVVYSSQSTIVLLVLADSIQIQPIMELFKTKTQAFSTETIAQTIMVTPHKIMVQRITPNRYNLTLESRHLMI